MTDEKQKIQSVEILANRYNSLAKANVLVTTSMDLRDGMVLTMTSEEAQSLYTGFWDNFVMRCIGKKYIQNNSLTDIGEPTLTKRVLYLANNDSDTYALIASFIYSRYNTQGFDINKDIITVLQPGTDSSIKQTKQITPGQYSNYRNFASHLMHVLQGLPSLPENAAPAAQIGQ
jgi:hypothetical protein